jgi:hydroxymethylglutaryl-CoA reductase
LSDNSVPSGPNLGGFMSGVNNNDAHPADGITALFIATGQGAANVAESSAAFVYTELRENGDFYYSVTIPSLIVAPYGGETGLATQRECLEMLGCCGKDQVRKLTRSSRRPSSAASSRSAARSSPRRGFRPTTSLGATGRSGARRGAPTARPPRSP